MMTSRVGGLRLVAGAVVLAAAGTVGVGQQAAAASGADVQVTTGLSYPTNHGPERMDLYRPPTSDGHGPFPGIVFVHGGGWSAGDQQEFAQEATAAAEHGYVGFAIDYDLDTPRDPREVQDVDAAIATIHDGATEYGVDPARLAGWGESAGAHLVMQAAVTDHAPLRAVVGWSGPYDLARFIGATDPQYAQLARDFLGCDPAGDTACTARADAASPALHTAAGDPAALLVNSADEIVNTDQPTRMADDLHAAGGVAQTLILPGDRHGIAYGDDTTAPSLQFLDQHLPVGSGSSGGTDPIQARYQALGGERSYLGASTGPEYAVAGGRAQQFSGGTLFWSQPTGAHAVHGAILARYQALGGPAGLLGFPTTDETTTPDSVGRYNHFAGAQGASIYWTPATGAWSVHGAIRSRWASLGWERGRLGYPTGDEYAVTGGRANHFAHGDITWDARTGTTTVHYR